MCGVRREAKRHAAFTPEAFPLVGEVWTVRKRRRRYALPAAKCFRQCLFFSASVCAGQTPSATQPWCDIGIINKNSQPDDQRHAETKSQILGIVRYFGPAQHQQRHGCPGQGNTKSQQAIGVEQGCRKRQNEIAAGPGFMTQPGSEHPATITPTCIKATTTVFRMVNMRLRDLTFLRGKPHA